MSRVRPCRSTSSQRNRRGFTLPELAISAVTTGILMAGIASSIMIATRAASTSNVGNAKVSSSLALADFVSELALAKSFSERTATAVTFKVADRDGDSSDETIRYSWSGQTRSPLVRTYNGTSANVAEDIYSFNLAYTNQASVIKKKILFVRGNVSGNPALYDRARRDLMHGWGFQVIPLVITAATAQTEVDSYLSTVDAVYISSTALPADVGSKFNQASVGVIVENAQLFDDLKIYANNGDTYNDDEVRVEINTHPITSEFNPDKITIVDSNLRLNCFDDATLLAPGAIKLCRQPNGTRFAMVAVERGGTLRDGTPAPGRRVTMPWGAADFNATIIASKGRTLFQRALNWASGAELVTGIDITLQSTWSDTAKFVTRAEVISKPAL